MSYRSDEALRKVLCRGGWRGGPCASMARAVRSDGGGRQQWWAGGVVEGAAAGKRWNSSQGGRGEW